MVGSRWVVLKFGGTSVATADGWRTIEAAVRGTLEDGGRAMVVCSALAGVSAAIEAAIHRALEGRSPGLQLTFIRRTHAELAEALGIRLPAQVSALFGELEGGLARVRPRVDDPRLRAALMGLGERMSTWIGALWLRSRGLPAGWVDARELLVGVDGPDVPQSRRFLSAEGVPTSDPERRVALEAGPPVVVTQGFVASAATGEPVLLGRGGSDTSAALLGTLLDAVRVEIWTDVPGLFTANPNELPEARLLPSVSYDEAETMAALGARVLHPRSVQPLRSSGIPLYVRSTYRPELAGTVVEAAADPGMKAVTSRSALQLVRMRRAPRWQPVGFLADVAACFQRFGLSIDLLSTSSGLVTATFDPQSSPLADLDGVLAELEHVCAVDIEGPVASVSLVGTALRSELPRIGAALAETGGLPIHLLAQGASDHHLTLVVDEDCRSELVAQLHSVLFEDEAVGGPTWRALAQGEEAA